TYDKNGNRKTQTGTPSGTYVYPLSGSNLQSNRLQSVSGGTNRTYTYDLMGNVTADGVNTYGYDGRGRLTSANGYQVSYNALGQRTMKRFGAYSRVTMYDESGHPLVHCMVISPGSCWEMSSQAYVWLGDIPVLALLTSGYTDYEGTVWGAYPRPFNIHTDHLNT